MFRSLPVLSLTLTLLLGAWGGALAQGQDTTETVVLDLTAALVVGPTFDTDLLNAQEDLAAAERDLARTRADPQALGLDLLAAEQAVAAARDSVEVASLAAVNRVTTAYTTYLEMQYTAAQAEIEHEIAATTLEATQARFQAGAATDLEAAQAANDLATAERSLDEARLDQDLALAELDSLLGTSVTSLAPIDSGDLQEIPTFDEVLAAAMERNTRVKAGERAVASARADLAATDNALSSRVQIEAASDALVSSERSLANTITNLRQSLRQTYANVTAARNRLQGAEESLGTSRESLAGQRARFEAGTISSVAFRQEELAALGSEASHAAALHDLLLAQQQLEAAVLE